MARRTIDSSPSSASTWSTERTPWNGRERSFRRRRESDMPKCRAVATENGGTSPSGSGVACGIRSASPAPLPGTAHHGRIRGQLAPNRPAGRSGSTARRASHASNRVVRDRGTACCGKRRRTDERRGPPDAGAGSISSVAPTCGMRSSVRRVAASERMPQPASTGSFAANRMVPDRGAACCGKRTGEDAPGGRTRRQSLAP